MVSSEIRYYPLKKVKEPGKRQKQFASTLRNILAKNIQDIVPQDLSSPKTLFSIGAVSVSADLRNAKVEIVCAAESMDENLCKLKKFMPMIRKKAAPCLRAKYMPNIRFVRNTYPETGWIL